MTAVLGWGVLWTRPLWTDELSLTFLVNEKSVTHMVADIARGGDWAPPLLHLILWTLTRLLGPLGAVELRSVSFVCVVGAVGFVYATLRRQFDRPASIAGALAVAGHPLVIAHAFEARFYAPWLLLAAGFAWSLGRRKTTMAVVAILLCTIHWFGIVSLGLMCLGAVATHGRRWREGLRLIAPSLAGFIALVLCLPLMFAQRSSSTGTWVPPLNSDQIVEMGRTFWFAGVPIIAAIVLLVAALRARSAEAPPRAGIGGIDSGVAALAALALMPLMLVFISAVLQPSMITRYGIVAALAWAPLVAFAVQSLGLALRVAFVVALSLLVVGGLSSAANEKRAYGMRVQDYRVAFDRVRATGVPVVFTSIHTLYPVVAPQRTSSPTARYLDLPDTTLTRLYPSAEMAWLRNFFRVERDVTRSQSRLFAFPIIATKSQLDTTPRFVLLATDASLPRGYKSVFVYGMILFPHHRVTRLSEHLSLFELATLRDSRTSR